MRGDGAFDVEAICASQEKAKQPNILTAGARFNKSVGGSVKRVA